MDTSFPAVALPEVALEEVEPPPEDAALDMATVEGLGAPKAGATPTKAIALIDCGGRLIGVSAAHMREVIPCPPELQPLPTSLPGVVGALSLRGLSVPVVCFGDMLGWQVRTPPEIIVVLREGEGLFAFRAHATRRIVLSDDIRFQEVESSSAGVAENLFPRLGLIGDDLVAMLEPASLAAMGVPLTRDTRPVQRSSDITEQYLLFELSGQSFVLPVARVDGTVPDTDVGGETLVSGPCEGSIRRLDMEIPLINPLTMAGMRFEGTRPRQTAAIILKFEGDKRIALRADRVRDIIQIKRSMIAPMPRILSPRSEFFTGVVAVSDTLWHQILDPDSIAADEGLRAFASLSRMVGAGTKVAEQRRQRGRRGVVLLFRSSGDFALPIEDVEEIVALPARVLEEPSWSHHLCNIAHRNQLVPIFCLATMLNCGPAAYTPQSAVIVTRVGNERVGLAVEEMLAIERLGYAEHPDGRPEGMIERPESGKVRTFSVVETGQLWGLG